MRKYINDKQLSKAIDRDVSAIMKIAMRELLEVVRAHVKEFVYDPFEGMATVYERLYMAGGFYASWKFSDIETKGNMLTEDKAWESLVFSDPQEMLAIPRQYVHSSDFFGIFEDRRDKLDAMLAEGWGYDFPQDVYLQSYGNYSGELWWTQPRDYWTPTIMLLNAGWLSSVFMDEMQKLGVSFW